MDHGPPGLPVREFVTTVALPGTPATIQPNTLVVLDPSDPEVERLVNSGFLVPYRGVAVYAPP
jgi:hypothetical protein